MDGLYYGSSMDGNAPCIALFERAADAIPSAPLLIRDLKDPGLLVPLQRAAQELGYGLR